MTVEEIKSKILSLEKGLSNPNISDAIKEGMRKGIEKLKKELETLEVKAEVKVEEAEKKVEEAETKTEKKEAQVELKEAVAEVKEVEKVSDKIEKVEEKAERVIGKHGGRRVKAGRKRITKMPTMKGKHGGSRTGAGRKVKASSVKRIVKPKKYKPSANKPVFTRNKGTKSLVKAKVKTVRAFGQTVEYKNDSEFCSKLISAFKKRRTVYKKSKKRTPPVFGMITQKVKDAVTKAIDNTPKKSIQANPKAFLAKAQRLEKSAIRFLEDFKSILGSDYKKSEISSEFGDLEKSIKKLVSKYK